VSDQTVERSTVGAGGLSRDTANAEMANTTTAAPAQTINRRFFFRNKSGRAISIAQGNSTWLAKPATTSCIENKAILRFALARSAERVTDDAEQLFDFEQRLSFKNSY
jgi:hypothetical protein